MKVGNVHNIARKALAVLLSAVLFASMCPAVAHAAEFAWPTPGISYMYRGFGNGHQGLDIAADNGTKVYSAASGTVMEVYTGCNNYDGADDGGVNCRDKGICNPSKSFYKDGFCNSAYGNAVIIRHDNGVWTSYAHLSSIAGGISVGARVSQGQLLGLSGSSGRSTGAHLHFEMRTGSSEYFWLNTAFDPLTRVSPEDSWIQDTVSPVISNVRIFGVSSDGYWVQCDVTDNIGVSKVLFPTWTTANGQDDLAENWETNYAGQQSGNTWSFYVSNIAHNYESGVYTTHIYAYDAAGNQTSVDAGLVEVPLKQVDVSNIQKGDVNLDGVCNAMDALLILKQSAGLMSMDAQQLQFADCDGDSIISASDALYVLKKAAGLL